MTCFEAALANLKIGDANNRITAVYGMRVQWDMRDQSMDANALDHTIVSGDEHWFRILVPANNPQKRGLHAHKDYRPAVTGTNDYHLILVAGERWDAMELLLRDARELNMKVYGQTTRPGSFPFIPSLHRSPHKAPHR